MMDNHWQTFFKTFPTTVTTEQLPVKLPRFDLDLCDLAGAAADWCHQYLKDRKCPYDLIVILTKIIINNLRIQWAAEPKFFGYRPEHKDYQALWLMRRVIEELNDVCLNHTDISYHLLKPILTSVWWSSFTLKNTRRQMEDYIAVVPYLHTLFDIKDFGEASFYAVYDGHNGLDAAVYSSMYLHQFLIQSEHYPTNPESALYEAFFTTDKGFTQKTEKYSLVSGTTAVCALYRPQEKKLYVGWVGDSIAMLWTNGTPLCLVNKHVPERYDETRRIESEGGMISKCQGIWRVDGQLAVSRAIGDVKYKPHITCKPEMRTLVLDGNEEFLVLGSDGLWEDVTSEDVAEIIYDELLETDGDVSEVSNKLAFKSKAQGSTDNISVITVFLQDPKQLVAKRRAVIMETAMEQRNATATLPSYGQDTGDFGPETDVDTPDDQISLTKPKVEGEANVIDESGEDSEEDGGGWNYYKKSTEEGVEKKTYQGEEEVDDQITGDNSDVEDMDYKLNPDAPEFVPVSSPPLSTTNHAQRFLNMDSDDFISSSPQKYKESIENLDVPDENDFTNEIKVHAADLSKLNNPYEPKDDSTMLNGIKSLNDDVTDYDESKDNFVFQNEHITNGSLDKYQNPFYSGNKIDLDKVQDLTDLLNDDVDTDTFNSDPYVSIMETSRNECNSTNHNNELQNESNIKLNKDFSLDEHINYEHDMNSKNFNDTISTANATIGSTLQFDDTTYKHDEDFKNEFLDGNHIDKLSQYDENKLNDSVSTTDAVLGSEPNTPMRMDNQSTFESENDDDQFSESFKQQLQLNQFDENNDKENHDPFCFEQTEDPAGIIPNIVEEVNEVIDETHRNDDTVVPNVSTNEKQVIESIKHEPVEEPLCIKEQAKPIHSVYEQEYLPESDFSASTHEALLNASENVSNHCENNVDTEDLKQQIIESHIDITQVTDEENQRDDEHLEQGLELKDTDDVELDDSDVDEIKYHAEGLKQEFDHDNTSDYEVENTNMNYVNNEIENLTPEHNIVSDENKYVDDLIVKNDQADYIENLVDNFETMPIENIKTAHNDIVEDVQSFLKDSLQNNYDDTTIQNHADNVEEENVNDVEINPISKDNLKEIDQLDIETVQNHEKNINEAVHDHTENVEHENVSENMENHIDEFKQENKVVSEVEHSLVDDFIQENHDIIEVEDGLVKDFKQENHDITEFEHSLVKDFKQENHDISETEYSQVKDVKQENLDISETEDGLVNDFKYENDGISEAEDNQVKDVKQENLDISETEDGLVNDFKQENYNISEVKQSHVDDFNQEHSIINATKNNFVEDFLPEHQNTADISYNNVDLKQEQNIVNEVENLKPEHSDVSQFVHDVNEDFHQQEQHKVESIQNHAVDSDEEMHSSMIIHSDVENNMPQPYCSENDALLIKEPDMMCTSMTFEENFQNRNMSDSLYVMETSSDYFGEEIQPSSQLEKSVDGLKVEEQPSNVENELVESKEILIETKSELVSESKIEEVKAETSDELNQSSSTDVIEKVDVQEENNKATEIAVATAIGAAAVAAVTGVSIASKKSATKKTENAASKPKTTVTKTASPKPLASKSTPILKKTTASSTTSKPLVKPATAPSTTSKSTTNVRPTTAPKTTGVKPTTAPTTKAAPKPAAKTTIPASRPTSVKTTPTTTRVSLTKTTVTASPKTPTSPKTTSATKLATTPKTNTTPRTSTALNKQSLTNGSLKPTSRPISAPAKKPLSSATTNGTTKLTNGDVSKSSTTKSPITLATRMSLAPPKLPAKAKAAPKTAPPAAMPGPIRRPKAPITKKTETATS